MPPHLLLFRLQIPVQLQEIPISQKFYEKLEETKDWMQMLTKSEDLIQEIIPEAADWLIWG